MAFRRFSTRVTVFEGTRVAERDGPAAAADEEAAAGDEGAAAADEGAAAGDEREVAGRDSTSGGGTVASARRFREAGPGTFSEGAAAACFAAAASAAFSSAASCLVLAIVYAPCRDAISKCG